jgi:hypothetical protein
MGSSRKKGGGQASEIYDYYGTLAGAVCMGPVDGLVAVVVDGVAVYEPVYPLAAAGNYTDLTSGIDAKWFTAGGYLRIYWGTELQTTDTAISEHPPYRGVCYIVAKNFLFGREKTTAPNVEVIVQRRPRPPTSLVHADSTALVDGQANPAAIAAELLTGPRLAGWPADGCDATSWLAVSAALQASTLAQQVSFASLLITERSELRRVIREILQAADLWVRERNGIIEIGQSERGGDVSELPLITHVDMTEAPRIKAEGWSDVPGRVIVKYHDRSRWKAASEAWDNPVARLIDSVGKEVTIDADWCTRRDQAQRLAAAWMRRLGGPGTEIVVTCRRQKVMGLLPGDRVRVDVDPEPADEVGLSVSGLIVDREEDGGDDVTLVIESDRLASPETYVAEIEATAPQAIEVPPIEHALAIALPPAGWGMPPAVAVLATRPDPSIVGMVVALMSEDDSEVVELGTQPGFAVRVTPPDGDPVPPEQGYFDLSLQDGLHGPDADLVSLEDPQDEIEARADRLLLVLAALDEDGAVAIDDDGQPIMEFCSLYAREVGGDEDYRWYALRGRLGLPARTWQLTTAVGWIVPAANLRPWRHEDFDALLLGSGDPAVLRLRSFSALAEDEDSSPPQIRVTIPPAYARAPRIDWTHPSGAGTTDGSGAITLSATITDREGDLIGVRMDSSLADGTSPATHLDVGFSQTTSYSLSVPVILTGDADLILTYIARIEARDRAGNIAIASRQIIRPQTGSTPTNLPPPSFAPAGGTFVNSGGVHITTGAGGSDVEYKIAAAGSVAPGTGTLTAGAPEVDVSLINTCRVWARSLGTPSPSVWVFADFERKSQSSGGFDL